MDSGATPRVKHTRKTVDNSDHNVHHHHNNKNNHNSVTGMSSAAETTTMGHQKGGENSSGQQQPPASANGSNSNKQHGHIIAGNRDSAPFEPSVEDQVAVGTDQILQSPHVSEGPGRVANAPVPSVFNDDRGSIHRLRVGGKRLNLLFSKTGVMRSGYLHPEVKHCFVFSGSVELWILTPIGTSKKIYVALDQFSVPAYVPHIFLFQSDSVCGEWWDQPAALACWLYHPYRRVVDVTNSLVSRSTGQHQLLVPEDDQYIKFQSLQNSSGLRSFVWWSTGLAMGIGIGTFLAKSLVANSSRRRG